MSSNIILVILVTSFAT